MLLVARRLPVASGRPGRGDVRRGRTRGLRGQLRGDPAGRPRAAARRHGGAPGDRGPRRHRAVDRRTAAPGAREPAQPDPRPDVHRRPPGVHRRRPGRAGWRPSVRRSPRTSRRSSPWTIRPGTTGRPRSSTPSTSSSGRTQLVTWYAHRSLGAERLAELEEIVGGRAAADVRPGPRCDTIPGMTELLDRTSFTYSIVIPVFNSEPIVGDTIDRVISTFTEAGLRYELILVNDGSSDHSWQVISRARRPAAACRCAQPDAQLRPALREPGRASPRPRATTSSPWTTTCRTRPTRRSC